MIDWLAFVGAGIISGLIAGLFGVGGGLVIVPVLMLVFSWQGMSTEIVMHVAVGTSLMAICLTSLSSMYTHHRYNNVDWSLFVKLAPALLLGSMSGAVIAGSLSGQWLQKAFALFALLMAVRLWLPKADRIYPRLSSIFAVSGFGLSAGAFSAMIGIGGGTLVVPYLVMAGERIQRAIGTAAACGFPIAISGAGGFIYMGSRVHQIDAGWQTGFVHWQAFIGIVATSVVFAPLGARLAKFLSASLLKRLFSVLLLLVGTVFLIR